MGPSTRDTRDERIQSLETQVTGSQSKVDEFLSREVQHVQTLNDQSKGDKAQKDKTTCNSIGIQKNPDDDDEPSAEVIVEASMMTSGDNEANDADMLGNSLFEDSDIDDADKIECLLDWDDVSDNDDTEEEELEEGEIVEVELENDNQKIVYEGCNRIIDTDVFDDDVIPEEFSEEVIDSEESDPNQDKQNPDYAKSLPNDTEMYKNT
ncbi:hypothetical protein L1987_65230 [Smallanthus sonchifolius]|uniref:Uncharacterized protein n=1 Tax=Smallanthus sonchifolius TaxID=185202 RepID=A0ACB9BTY0_9ASTR|nr:hypothetical protein L1987_65230 [Smallanthus sonchifolius]